MNKYERAKPLMDAYQQMAAHIARAPDTIVRLTLRPHWEEIESTVVPAAFIYSVPVTEFGASKDCWPERVPCELIWSSLWGAWKGTSEGPTKAFGVGDFSVRGTFEELRKRLCYLHQSELGGPPTPGPTEYQWTR